jgi:hypothetical protein
MTVAIMISTNLKGWNLGPGLAGEHADIEVKGHICAYERNAPNNKKNTVHQLSSGLNAKYDHKVATALSLNIIFIFIVE